MTFSTPARSSPDAVNRDEPTDPPIPASPASPPISSTGASGPRLDAKALGEALAARPREILRVEGFRDAAVLVPILVEPGAPDRLILTLRQERLRSHAGQIAFPGGKRDAADPDLAA